MPIYEQTYRRYEARAPLRTVRFWPITREALRLILARRAFLGLLLVAWGQFLFRVIQVYVVTRLPEAGRVLPIDGRMFGQFLAIQTLFTLLLSIFGGAGLIANDLRMLAFGEDDARSRGVNVERVKWIGFGASSIVTGAAVAVSGIIGFVGLLVPHLMRLAWRRDFRFLLPLCALGGASLLVGADLVSRIAVPPAELPLGAFTAILGVPFFLSLLRRAR